METFKDEITEIFSGTLWEAELVKSLLLSAEINSFLKNAVMNNYAFEPGLANGVKVMILRSEFERAKSIVDDFYRNMKESKT
jgi:hypothetical protein